MISELLKGGRLPLYCLGVVRISEDQMDKELGSPAVFALFITALAPPIASTYFGAHSVAGSAWSVAGLPSNQPR